MKTIEESVVSAMDGSDIELFPFLPYILQDIWEIVANPGSINNLIKKHCDNYGNLQILDLGCGKGAVSVKISKALGCKCFGIDAIPEFIEFAKQKASEYQVDHLCVFETGDIREKVEKLSGYDIIILGAIGTVFGDYYSTLTTLSGCLKGDGILIIDDGYIEESSNYDNPLIQKRDSVLMQIEKAGMKLVEEDIFQASDIKDTDDLVFEKLKERCSELIKKYPQKEKLFLDYIQRQIEENDVLENKIVCSTLVIKRE